MKLSLDPMPGLRAAAVSKINAQFNVQAQPHVDAAHARKREIAQAVKAGGEGPIEFVSEAALRGKTPAQFADLILSKAAALDARELQRQMALMKLETLTTPDEIAALLSDLAKG
jgi:hypothetical protein